MQKMLKSNIYHVSVNEVMPDYLKKSTIFALKNRY